MAEDIAIPCALVRERVSAAEWAARVELAACYRLLDRYGMTDLVYNHVTLRVPGTERLLINAYGYLYSEICASNLVTVDLEGRVLLGPVDENGYGVNRAGMVIHTAIHKARPDVACVIHTHTRAGMAVSAMKPGLLPLNQTAMRFYGRCGYHDFDSPLVELTQQGGLVRSLGSNEVVVLRNHGLLAVGPSVAEAFNRMYFLEMACRAQVDAVASGLELVYPPAAVMEETLAIMDRRPMGVMEWPAMLRQVERMDPGYKE